MTCFFAGSFVLKGLQRWQPRTQERVHGTDNLPSPPIEAILWPYGNRCLDIPRDAQAGGLS